VGGVVSCLCCLCLFGYSGIQLFVILCVFGFLVSCCGVRMGVMFGSSLPSVLCGRAYVLFVFVCIRWCPMCLDCMIGMVVSYKRQELIFLFLTLLVFCGVLLVLFVFLLCFLYPILPVSLDCPFFIAPSVFSNVYPISTRGIILIEDHVKIYVVVYFNRRLLDEG